MSFERKIERIRSAAIDIDLFVVPWDSRVYGFPVAQLENINIKSNGNAADARRLLEDWLNERDVGLASCRLASDKLRHSMFLEESGFRFVEMVYGPTLSPLPSIDLIDERLTIEQARPSDLPSIEAIAASAFSTSRLVLDWRLDASASGRRYESWVRTSFGNPRQEVLTAKVDNDIVGFFVIERRSSNAVYWHLTAVSPSCQGQGLGKTLWRAMVARHQGERIERIDTTISAHNTAVMNVYARLGFRFSAPQMTFHWVRT